MTLAVYSPARAAHLRVMLWAAVVVAVAFLGLAALVLLPGGSVRFGLFLGVPAALVLLCAVLSLLRLDERGRAARAGATAAGGLLVVVGLLAADLALGILPTIVGVLLLLVALLREPGER